MLSLKFFDFVSSAYACPSLLFCGDHTLLSAEGVQQEDTLLSAEGVQQGDTLLSAEGVQQGDTLLSAEGVQQGDTLLSAEGVQQGDTLLSAEGVQQGDTLLSAEGVQQGDTLLSAEGVQQGDTLLSAEGVQQGDPLGPLLFCIMIQPLIQRLHSVFSVFNLDNGTIGGSRDDVLADLQLMENEAATLGLKLNCSKTELVSSDVGAQNSILSIVSELKVVPCSQVSLLGTPIGSLELLDSTIEAKTKKLQPMGMRLSGLRSQDALCLLRHSFAIPKVLFILRSAPCFLSNHLEAFDGLLRSLLLSILNISLDHDASRLQATLPVRAGGLGVRRAAQLAPSAF